MSHVVLNLDIESAIKDRPIELSCCYTKILWFCVLIGLFVLTIGWSIAPPELFWGAFYTNFIFFTGLSIGSVMIAAIFQIVRARWSPPIRRIAEANCWFYPWVFIAFLTTYFGKEALFPWANEPMPGREWWMEPCFVYTRFTIFLGILLYLLYRFVMLSVRADIALVREKSTDEELWRGWFYQRIIKNWKGAEEEVGNIQSKLSRMAPVLVILYVAFYTMFSTEMISSMDTIWYANMFGGFYFVGNIYLGWVTLVLLINFFRKIHPGFAATITNQQYHDLGKLTFGFCMLWGYLFFSHFLPQWYGNLPEETQWLILRTREYPWRSWSWVTFSMCFVIPFIMLLSRDLKRTPWAYGTVCAMIFFGIWSEKYVVIMPNFSPDKIPFGIYELGLFLLFAGTYLLSIQAFLRRFPYLPVSHPLTRGDTVW